MSTRRRGNYQKRPRLKLQTIDHYYEQGEDQEVGHKEGMLTIEITTQTMIMISRRRSKLELQQRTKQQRK